MRVIRKQNGRNGWPVERVWKGRIEKNPRSLEGMPE